MTYRDAKQFPDVDRRTVLLPERDMRAGNYVAYQRNYMDQTVGRLIPSTDVYVGGELRVRVNSLGCKGEELEPGVPVVGLFGDSFIQGVDNAGFPSDIHIPGVQALNAAVEGAALDRTVDIFLEIQAKQPMVCAAIHGGWHNLMYNRADEAFWSEHLDRIEGPPVIAHFTLVGDINAVAVERGYNGLFNTAPTAHPDDLVEARYFPWLLTEEEYGGSDRLRELYARMQAYNRFIRDYCQRKGRVLIDLEAAIGPARYADIGVRFFDMVHLRPSSYRAAAAEVERQLGPHIEPLVRTPTSEPAAAKSGDRSAPGGITRTGMNYPLW